MSESELVKRLADYQPNDLAASRERALAALSAGLTASQDRRVRRRRLKPVATAMACFALIAAFGSVAPPGKAIASWIGNMIVPEGTAHISETIAPESLQNSCREILKVRKNDSCGFFLEVQEAKQNGTLKPGNYSQVELERILSGG